MKKKMLACLTACMMLASAGTVTPVQAADPDAETGESGTLTDPDTESGETGESDEMTDPLFGVLPDWVPHDFASAMQFRNTHGKSYVADGIICLVRPMAHFRTGDYTIDLSGSMTLVNTPASSPSKIYELEIPEKPDPEDAEAVKAYNDYCDSVGNYTHDYSFFETYAGCKTQTAFEVTLLRVLDNLELNVAWLEKDGEGYKTTEKFRFCNTDGNVFEADFLQWVPDCKAEYDAWLDHYGRASVQGQYIAYCAEVNGSTGAQLKMTQESDDGGEIKQIFESDCTPFTWIAEDGSGSDSIILYQPVKYGTVYVNWTVGRDIPGEEPFEQTEGQYEISDNGMSIRDISEHLQQSLVLTFLDAETGELIDTSSGEDVLMRQWYGESSTYETETYKITSNPFKFDENRFFVWRDEYFFYPHSGGGYYENAEFEQIGFDQYQARSKCKMTWHPDGDLNGKDDFNIADIVLLEKLLRGEDVRIKSWKAAEFRRDNKLDAADLSLMKRAYFRKTVEIVKPEITVDDYNSFFLVGDNLNLYAGPGMDYMVMDILERDSVHFEKGYNKDNDDWVYNGNGWIKTKCNDGETPNIRFITPQVDKPVIYLYPEQETDVHVELELTTSELATTYPKYQNGWDVTASPDGSLLNKADGTHHRYLFWDAVNCRTRFDFSKGFCVAGSDTESFLKEKLTNMGLTEEEMNEFIVYWLPRMERNPYNLIAFQGKAYTDTAKLHITPEPDSMLRVFMTYVPLEQAVEIEPQQFSAFDRTGFTVVEWGGSEIPALYRP